VSLLAYDQFNQPDGALSANWTTVGTQQAFQIAGNLVEVGQTTGNDDHMCWVGPLYGQSSWPNDQWGAVTLNTLGTSQSSMGVCLRAATGARTDYFASLNGPFGIGAGWNIQKYVAAVRTSLAVGNISFPSQSGSVLYFEVIGSVLRLLLDGQEIGRAADTAITSGNVGMMAQVNGQAVTDGKISLFRGGDFVQPSGLTSKLLYVMP
jgi:hypothetical protein